MKFKNNLLIVMALFLVLSCNQDNLDVHSSNSVVDEDFRIPNPQYDDSNLGVYKGLFTTLQGDLQGELLISIDKDRAGIAELKLSTGETITLESPFLNESSTDVDHLNFSSMPQSSKSVSLNFTVGMGGSNPLVTDVIFDSKESSVLIAKDMLRAPVNPVFGTYSCTNCTEVYPQFSSAPLTFSLMYSGPQSDLTITTSIVYEGNEFVSTNNMMDGCSDVGTSRTCDISGNPVVRGKVLDFTGIYQFRFNQTPCSYTTGDWTMDIGPALLQGTFISNNTSPCP